MTQDEINTIKAEISAGIEAGSTLATAVAPQYAPFIVLGKAVAKLIGPAVFEDIVLLVQKAQPTAEDAAAIAIEIAGLSKPETL